MNEVRRQYQNRERPAKTEIQIQPMDRLTAIGKPSAKQIQEFETVMATDSIQDSFLPTVVTEVEPQNMCRLVWLMLIICIGPFYVGNTIFLSASSYYNIYKFHYNIPLPEVLSFSMINGIVPCGGILGSVTLALVMKYTNKRDIVVFYLVFSFIFCAITMIPFFQALMIGRFLLGTVCSWQNSIAALLIRDFSPVKYRRIFNGVYFSARVIGIASIFAIGYIYEYQPPSPQFWAMNLIPVYICIIQVILTKMFLPLSPVDLVAQNKSDELRDFFITIYARKDVDKAVDNWIREFKHPTKVFQYVNQGRSEELKDEANKIYARWQSRMFFISMQTSVLRQFCGVNYLTLYAKLALQNLHYEYYKAGPILISLVLIGSSFLGLAIVHKYPRRPLLLIGVAGAFAGALTVAITDYTQNFEAVLIGEVIFMFFVGTMVGPISWPYPVEVAQPQVVKHTSLIGWIAATVVASSPVRQRSYQFFFAVSTYLFYSLIVSYLWVVETKNLNLREVYTNLMKESYIEAEEKAINNQ